MNLTPQEAAEALHEIEKTKKAMRSAIRSHRGHLFLWIWGGAWVVMALLGWAGYAQRHPWSFCWVCAVGLVASFATRTLQNRVIRSTFDRRFLGVCAALLAFSYLVWPMVLHANQRSFEEMYTYCELIWMQLYVVAGILFSNLLLWVGIIVTGLLLSGLYLLPALFWPACVLSGLTLVASGVFIRSYWRP